MKYDAVVKYAKEKFPQVEAIVSAYTMQIIWVNEKLTKISEYSPEELIDKSVRDIVIVDSAAIMSFVSGRNGEKQTIKTKTGKLLKGTTDIRSFTFDKEVYFATFNSSFEPMD